MTEIHVVPLNDLEHHDEAPGSDCACGPQTRPVQSKDGRIGFVVVHHSLDGREEDE